MIPADLLRQLQAFADRVDRLAPGTLSGLYAVGSVALGDFRPSLSNLDVLAVSDDLWTPAGVRAARRASRALHLRRQPPRVACLTWADLAADPTTVAPPCLRGRRPLDAGELVNPFTWQVLRTAGVCVRGPEYPDLGAGDLRGWAAARLSGPCASWLARYAERPGVLWLRRSTSERVLEAARLAQVVSSGRVVSKLEAGDLAVAAGPPRYQRILKDSVGFRRGDRMSMYWGPFERKRAAIAFIAAAC